MKLNVKRTNENHLRYADEIYGLMRTEEVAGVVKRSLEYLKWKIYNKEGIIALDSDDKLVGFCNLSTWDDGNFTEISSVIIVPDYRGKGISKQILSQVIDIVRSDNSETKIITFALPNGPILKSCSALGLVSETYEKLPLEEKFWHYCEGCKNHDVLIRNNKTRCLCKVMVLNRK